LQVLVMHGKGAKIRLAAVVALLAAGAYPAHTISAGETKTLKEQLSDKASDEQRVDNCGVPPERRGSVPRPDCADKPLTAAPAAGQSDAKTAPPKP
jgi:hypothetical protein